MKKLSVCFLILFLCLCCFAACDTLLNPEELEEVTSCDGHWHTEESEVETSGCEHEHTGEMLINEYTHSYQYTCGCPSNEIAEMHLDSDGDERCDICEYNMSEHEHIYENHHDENGHGWSYTCGCLTPPNFALHSDGDNDGECDVCGYDGMSVDYTLTMNDPEWLYEDLKPTYKVGEIVSVKIRMAYDLGYIFLVNGARVYDDRYVSGEYWEFTFTMPERDTEIDFLTYDGFLPDRNYSVLIEAYWIKHQDAEYVYIDKYYGETGRGALVAMIVAGDYSDEEWQEKIGTVYYRGKFYTLTEAYSEGYVTLEELQKIAEQHASEE